MSISPSVTDVDECANKKIMPLCLELNALPKHAKPHATLDKNKCTWQKRKKERSWTDASVGKIFKIQEHCSFVIGTDHIFVSLCNMHSLAYQKVF